MQRHSECVTNLYKRRDKHYLYKRRDKHYCRGGHFYCVIKCLQIVYELCTFINIVFYTIDAQSLKMSSHSNEKYIIDGINNQQSVSYLFWRKLWGFWLFRPQGVQIPN